MKYLLTALLLGCANANAVWYRVQNVNSYNSFRATEAGGDKEPVVIRIRNLEKIEYIQSDPEKVLIGGKEASGLAAAVLQNQLVWVENLKAEEGAYAADVYPSFEQVMTVYKEHRIVNGDNISPAAREALQQIYRQMIVDLNLKSLSMESDTTAKQTAEEVRNKVHKIYLGIISDIRMGTPRLSTSEKENSKSYEGDFQRTLFVAEALIWFRKNAQLMHPAAQKLYVDLLASFENDSSLSARHTQFKIERIQQHKDLFLELFLNEGDFERGKFTYTCMDWFKNRGQYLPADVQNVFITWLKEYQRTNSSDGQFMRERLQWMIDNNGLYQDFLGLSK